MAEKGSFLNWVGFKGEESNAPGSVDRIRELEAQLADLRSRRDVTTLSKEEFEILATETAMTMIKSAQLRESKAQATSDRVINETARQAKDALDSADQKAKALLSSAESRGRKYIEAAESDAQELRETAEIEAETLIETKKREASHLTSAARREGERMISEAAKDVVDYRQWLSGVISEAERLYKIQTQSLDSAESAIHQSRTRLEVAFNRLAELQKSVIENLRADGTLIKPDPIKVTSERTKPALDAPKRTAAKKPVKKVAKKTAPKRK
ncbi:MAG: hypothetical protein F2704_02905 [Actinobacteria bacterium]|uniref:Unannotated protein n=1 Tax=freshwater metagenome TaxID=449393 RepID=A0A6J7IJB9_9ZZZZ|nr:hypothetical protein [Actinomycetota bacterium]MSW47960.1 hypothetical protein [Actinomycetota bacterium]MSX25021.1 hypothetical protein [Actinomycetota bacterium]MSY46511.1 hypothetical protein [Actinomycetota bacterium]MSY57205.1 hypothetical protein [Actinomycetota bacterium]